MAVRANATNHFAVRLQVCTLIVLNVYFFALFYAWHMAGRATYSLFNGEGRCFCLKPKLAMLGVIKVI